MDHATGPSALLGRGGLRFDRVGGRDPIVARRADMTAMAVRPPSAVPEAGMAAPGVTEEVAAAERSWWRGLVIGIVIGVPVCAVIWVGIVAAALAVAGGDWPMAPALGMAAVVGVFAGMFLGGWAGVTTQAEALDHAERHSQHLE
jgi:hypothetical protein